MFIIKSITYFNLISLIIAQNVNNDHHLSKFHEDTDIIIDPLELLLRSTDTEGIFYCHSLIEINKQQNKLTASIEKPILTSPKFLFKTELLNSTTIRIRIIPNGYIGINRINCHWNNNLTYGQTADLIIGEKPGVIQLKEPCLAYDRRYVQCIFRASIIARAFRNGFPRIYKFSELDPESIAYRSPPVLVNITNDNELVFHFEPRERYVFPKKTLMIVNMTLSRFGPSEYRFYIEPLHTTKVDFQIEDVSSKQFTIRINHNNTGTISQRLCSGHISQVDEQNTSILTKDITETSNQTILINRLRPSIQYKICLRCFYEQTDQSSKEEKCEKIKTTSSIFSTWLGLLAILVGVIVVALSVVGCVLFRRNRHVTLPLPNHNSNKVEHSSATHTPSLRYDPEPDTADPLIPSDTYIHHQVIDPSHVESYQPLNSLMEALTDENKVAPDTFDLPRQKNA